MGTHGKMYDGRVNLDEVRKYLNEEREGKKPVENASADEKFDDTVNERTEERLKREVALNFTGEAREIAKEMDRLEKICRIIASHGTETYHAEYDDGILRLICPKPGELLPALQAGGGVSGKKQTIVDFHIELSGRTVFEIFEKYGLRVEI